MYLTTTQVEALLRPIDQGRVLRTQGFNYLEQHDVRRWLTRIFGFARWSMAVNNVTLIDATERHNDAGELTGKWDVIYRATVTLTVCAPDGEVLANYTDVATGDSQNTPLIGAHDLALKSAVSGALKRAAVSLGDQFGLSLYWDGQEAFTTKVKRVAVGGQHTPEDDTPLPTEDEPVTAAEPEHPAPEPEEAQDGTEEPAPETTEEVVDEDDGPDPQHEMAAALVRLAANPDKKQRSQALTKLSLTIGKAGWQTAMTQYGVTMTVLLDRAFAGEVTDE
jgi:recombination DNA repair RAD52 pathway protein